MSYPIRYFLQAVAGRAYPRVVGMNREKSWLFFEIFLPLLSTSAYVLVYQSMGAPEEFKGFVLIGGAMIAFWINVLWSMAMQLFWDKEQGNLTLYLTTPAPMMAILTGMAFGGFLATLLRAVVILTVGSLIFGISYAGADLPPVLAIFLLSLVALYGMGMLLASAFLVFGRGAWQVGVSAQEWIGLAGGFYFPVRNLGVVVASAASAIPLTLGLDAMRQLLYPQMMSTIRFLPVPVEAGILAVLAVIYILAARFALHAMEQKSRRDGKLTERGG